MSRKLFLLLALLALVAGAGAQAQENTPRPLTFFMTFVPNVQFAPVYAALENGDFAAAGLDITVEHGFDEALGVERIALNELQFGLISGEQIIRARAQQRPVVYVYAWFQQYPVGIVTALESGIASINDLRGRRVGIPVTSGASYSGLTAILAANNLTLNDIQLETIGFNAPEVLCIGGVDAAVIYTNNEPLQIQLRAEQGDCGDISGVRVFPVSEFGNLVSNGIVTNEETIANDPELVRAFVGAFDSGLRAVIDNPAQAFLWSAQYVEGLLTDDALRAALENEAAAQTAFLATAPDSAAVADSRLALRERLAQEFDNAALLQFDVLLESILLWQADQPGYSDAASWEAMQNTLLALIDPATGSPILPQAIDLSQAFSNEFLPEAAEGA
ncbi:MAG: ABC transporter substrate-binding protein [Chloroflexi bacterium]|nr:ABC transporter substrate-binding protein [Chloroflexota bacterium]